MREEDFEHLQIFHNVSAQAVSTAGTRIPAEEASRLEIAFGRGGWIVSEDHEADGLHAPRTHPPPDPLLVLWIAWIFAPRSGNRATTRRAEPMTARWSGVPPNLSPRSKSDGSASSS
jgi:hypothetical protein